MVHLEIQANTKASRQPGQAVSTFRSSGSMPIPTAVRPVVKHRIKEAALLSRHVGYKNL